MAIYYRQQGLYFFHLRALWFAALVISPLTTCLASDPPVRRLDLWETCGSYEYLLDTSKKTWHDQKTFCRQHNGELAMPKSDEEQSCLDHISGSLDVFWIGIVRPPGSPKKKKSSFDYIDGTSLYADRWISGQPGNTRTVEECVTFWRTGGNIGWADEECWHKWAVVCQRVVNCTELTAPENGAMTVGSDQRSVTFTCNTGYLLQGTDIRFCGANGTWNGTTATCSEPDSPLQCTSNSMSYALDKRIAPPTLYEIPHLLNDTCLAVDNSTHYIFNFGYDDCGTEIVHFQGELYYSNVINAKVLHTLPDTPKDPESQIITSLLTIRLQCKFNKEVHVTTYEANYGYIVPVSQNPIFNVTGIGLFSSSMNVFTDSAFSENMKKGTTHVYRPNQRAYFEIHITYDRRLSVRAQECWVNVGKYDTFPKAFVLRNGCPVDGNVAALMSHSSPGSNTHRLSYRVFGINGYEDRIQYFHCTARVCSANDSAAFCNKGCESGARRRREAPANTNVVEASDRNPYFTFSTPGFFVAPSSDADVLPTTTPKTSGGDGSRSLIILFIMISSGLAYLLSTI